jgi:multiple sugar transport system permease protein/putative chitobiose transport system permease protein
MLAKSAKTENPLASSQDKSLEGRLAPHVGKPALQVAGTLLMVLYGLFSAIPLLWMLVGSFSTDESIFANSMPFSLRAFVPYPFTLEGYNLLISSGFFHALQNTVVVTLGTLMLGLFVNSLAGYTFALFDFPGKGLLFALVMVTMALPPDVLAIPLYTLIYGIGWVGKLRALIVPAVASGFVIFLLRQAVLGIPRSLIDASRIDGLGWFQIYWRIALPLIRGSLIGGGLIITIGIWQSFLWPLLVGTTSAVELIQVSLAYFQQEHTTLWNAIFAGSAIAVAVPILLLGIMQRHFRPSLLTSGNK